MEESVAHNRALKIVVESEYAEYHKACDKLTLIQRIGMLEALLEFALGHIDV